MTPADSPNSAARVFVNVHGPLAEQEARRVCDRVRVLLSRNAARGIICRIRGPIDLSVVDVLARLQLIAQRRNAWLQVSAADEDLRALIALLAFTGLEGALREQFSRTDKRLEPRRQAEPSEKRRVEEVVNVDDLPG